jgi:hypothetical protein
LSGCGAPRDSIVKSGCSSLSCSGRGNDNGGRDNNIHIVHVHIIVVHLHILLLFVHVDDCRSSIECLIVRDHCIRFVDSGIDFVLDGNDSVDESVKRKTFVKMRYTVRTGIAKTTLPNSIYTSPSSFLCALLATMHTRLLDNDGLCRAYCRCRDRRDLDTSCSRINIGDGCRNGNGCNSTGRRIVRNHTGLLRDTSVIGKTKRTVILSRIEVHLVSRRNVLGLPWKNTFPIILDTLQTIWTPVSYPLIPVTDIGGVVSIQSIRAPSSSHGANRVVGGGGRDDYIVVVYIIVVIVDNLTRLEESGPSISCSENPECDNDRLYHFGTDSSHTPIL